MAALCAIISFRAPRAVPTPGRFTLNSPPPLRPDDDIKTHVNYVHGEQNYKIFGSGQ